LFTKWDSKREDNSKNCARKWCVRKDEHDNHGTRKEHEIACMIPLTVLGRSCRYCCLLNKHRPFKFFGWWHPKGGMNMKDNNNSFLKILGCEEFLQFDKENRTKLEAKSRK